MKELFKNCLFVDEVDGWYIPSRFTRKQLEYYRKEFPTLIRSNASSSVALRFFTSATKLTFDYKIGYKARNWAVIDVICDGELYSSLSLDADEGIAELTLPGEPESDITVFLPHLVAIKIKNIEANAPLIPVTDSFLRWLALGDSITQGMVARSPSSPYPSAISVALGNDLLNAAVGGIEFNADELDYIGYDPDLITVALGTNDWGSVTREELTARVTAYFDKLLSLYKCDSIYVITPIWRSDDDKIASGMTFAEHRSVIAEAISRYPGIKIVDGYELVPHDPALFGDPGERQVHPNEQGFEHYSSNLFKIIFEDMRRKYSLCLKTK